MEFVKTVKCGVCEGAGMVPKIQPGSYRIIRERAGLGLREAARKGNFDFTHLSRLERGQRKGTPEIDRFYSGLAKNGK